VRKAVDPRTAHQHRRDGNPVVDFLVPVVHDACFHQIGDAVSDRAGMDTEPPLFAERPCHGLWDGTEPKFDRRTVRYQPRDVFGDRTLDRPGRPRR
jgi:hypothetical protein